MKTTRTLLWISRALFAVGALLLIALFVYAVKASGSTAADDGKIRVFAILFCSIAWCLFAGGAVRTLATATKWPRALLDIASTTGFGLFFTAVVFLISGTSSVFPVTAFAIVGF